MTLLSRGLGMVAKLPPATTRRVRVDRGLTIPVDDGVTLVADRYYPEAGGNQLPILLCRTPYGRGAEGLLGRLFAERGYQVLVVSCRGTFGSGGEWQPFWNEQSDGHAVLAWIEAQPWFSGSVGLFGGSYHGLTQWAVAEDAPAFVKAMSPMVTASNFAEFFYPGGSFALQSSLTWTYGLSIQELPKLAKLLAFRRGRGRLGEGVAAMPLGDADATATGHHVSYFQDWLDNADVKAPFWKRIDFGKDVSGAPAASLIAGWYDIFMPMQVKDFQRLREAGRDARLRVGPWAHGNVRMVRYYGRDTLRWMDTHLAGGNGRAPEKRVQLFVMGAKKWVGFDEWPPPATPSRWHLQPEGALSRQPANASAPDRYRYDPADPTPGIGGATLYTRNAGPQDNRRVEARADVLVYSTPPLTDALTVIGPVRAELFVRSSLEHTDFFVRLCDVAPNGRSTNVSDGILRVGPGDLERDADGIARISVELSPTANTFRRGHRIRVQVSSGAHPIYARNPGTGEPLGRETHLLVADQEVFHDPERASAIVLPVVSPSL